MNIFQAFNNALSAATLVAIVVGIFRDPTPIRERPPTLALFAGFLFLLRLKIFLDDHKYFQAPPTKDVHFKIGFVVGVASWLLWILCAYSLKDLQDAYFLAGWAIGISTIWIVAVALKRGAYHEQYIWIATNAIFVLLLWAVYRRNAPTGDWITWGLLGLAIGLLVIDWIFSKSVPELDARPRR
jgi:predicted neutral ceramidase superfamily lipid hydrolase